MFREIKEEVETMNEEQETLQKEQAGLKLKHVKLPEIKKVIIENEKPLSVLNGT